MPGRNEDAWGGVESPCRQGRKGFVAAAGTIAARALEAESERWFLRLPVLFATGILSYLALDAETVSEDRAFNCDPLGCIGRVKGKIVALVRHPRALEEGIAAPPISSLRPSPSASAAVPRESPSTGIC